MLEPEKLKLFPHHDRPSELQSLQAGCYYIGLDINQPDFKLHLHGSLRVETVGGKIAVSGDLYRAENPDGTAIPLPDETRISQQQVPLFPVHLYDSYLKLVGINGNHCRFHQYVYFHTSANGHPLKQFDIASNGLPQFDVIQLELVADEGNKAATPSFQGVVLDDQQNEIGTYTLDWVSPFFRRFNLEIDALQNTDMPALGATSLDWEDIFKSIGWSVNVVADENDRIAPTGQSWNNGELHARMLEWRNRHQENSAEEWWYYLLCIHTHEDGHLGIMFDDPTFDNNKIAREGAAICARKVLDSAQGWPAPIAGKTLSEIPPAYFRTALHELGHMMGLIHEPLPNTRLMNQTNVINFQSTEDAPAFPENISWVFAPKDEICLKHMPDIWVRPGGIGWNVDFNKNTAILNDREETEITTDKTSADSGSSLAALTLAVEHLSIVPEKDGQQRSLKDLPFGMPVRISVRLKLAEGAAPIEVPASLSLKTGFIKIEVKQLGLEGNPQSLQSVIYFEGAETGLIKLDDKSDISHAYTLLHNKNGALFPVPGNYNVRVTLQWPNSSGREASISGETRITIAQPVSEEHRELADQILQQPEVTQMIIFGGWHLENGFNILDLATTHPNLGLLFGAHYAITLSKCYSRRFFDTPADMDTACAYLKKYDYIVLNESEIIQAAKIVRRAADSPDYNSEEKQALVREISQLLHSYTSRQCDNGFCNERTREAVKTLINPYIQKE